MYEWVLQLPYSGAKRDYKRFYWEGKESTDDYLVARFIPKEETFSDEKEECKKTSLHLMILLSVCPNAWCGELFLIMPTIYDTSLDEDR